MVFDYTFFKVKARFFQALGCLQATVYPTVPVGSQMQNYENYQPAGRGRLCAGIVWCTLCL